MEGDKVIARGYEAMGKRSAGQEDKKTEGKERSEAEGRRLWGDEGDGGERERERKLEEVKSAVSATVIGEKTWSRLVHPKHVPERQGVDPGHGYAVDAPTTAVDAPTTAVDAPTTAVDAPTTAVDAPTTAVDAPTTTVDAPTTTVHALHTTVHALRTTVYAPTNYCAAPTNYRACPYVLVPILRCRSPGTQVPGTQVRHAGPRHAGSGIRRPPSQGIDPGHGYTVSAPTTTVHAPTYSSLYCVQVAALQARRSPGTLPGGPPQYSVEPAGPHPLEPQYTLHSTGTIDPIGPVRPTPLHFSLTWVPVAFPQTLNRPKHPQSSSSRQGYG
ncbi:HERV-H LTR-associating protein 1 [Venturia nashicola]|uniref:HERV-H LTR-associating protein 1 n=1 Tax=Venturia nashicola TaxID=86259 RepID=A0A4Z1NJ76_9PEZI|nr:HERV-H LTR-associating protein 1 [Venturia nashicola]